ncbi:MAG: hypothetical protein K6G24_08340 [Lachnospiraceae bacterium]|nr:hypothetical protein [Lachnospiraceae bacterium]
MYCCSSCFKTQCRCNSRKINIDHYVYPAVYEFNRKGYITEESCSGHADAKSLETYIMFKQDLDYIIDSDLIYFDTYKYNGVHVRKNVIKAKPEICQMFKKKRPDKSKIIRDINKELYRIAKAIPANIPEEDLSADTPISEDFFDQDTFVPDITDLHEPWMLILPFRADYIEKIEEFFGVIENNFCLYEIVINQMGYRHCFSYLDGKGTSRNYYDTQESLVKDRIVFDITSLPRLVQFGLEKDIKTEIVVLENESYDDVTWYLSYANHEERYYDDSQNQGVSSDIQQFNEKNVRCDKVDVFAYGFELLIQKGIHICAFSSEHSIIVFSDRIDFSYNVSESGMSIIFGQMAEDSYEYSHIKVSSKKCFVFADQALLVGKEI